MNLPFPLTLAALAACGIGATLLVGCGSAGRTIAVASPAPTASATPTPIPDPLALSRYLVTASRDSDAHAFSSTTSSYRFGSGNIGPFTSTYTQRGGTLFSTGFTGKTTVATLTTAQGAVKVSRQETLDSASQVTGYRYFTEDSSGCSEYGSDTLDSETGQLSASDRYDSPIFYSYDLVPGQSQTLSAQITHREYALGTGALESAYPTSTTVTFTFGGTESVTVPAGVFTAARVTLKSHVDGYPDPISSYDSTTTIDTAAGVGTVKSVTTTSGFLDSGSYSSTETDLLASAMVGGVHYGP